MPTLCIIVPIVKTRAFIPGRDYGKKLDRKWNSGFIKKKLYILIKKDNWTFLSFSLALTILGSFTKSVAIKNIASIYFEQLLVLICFFLLKKYQIKKKKVTAIFCSFKWSTLYKYLEYNCRYRLSILKMNFQGFAPGRDLVSLRPAPWSLLWVPCGLCTMWLRHVLRGYAFQMQSVTFQLARRTHVFRKECTITPFKPHMRQCVFYQVFFQKDKIPQNWMISDSETSDTSPPPNSGRHYYYLN